MKHCRLRKRSLAYALMAFALTASTSAQPGPLGRLFYSVQERAALEALRNAPKSVAAPAASEGKPKPRSVIVASPPAGQQKSAPPRPQVMTGFVERSSGANTVWIDNHAQQLEGGYGKLDPRDVGKARRK